MPDLSAAEARRVALSAQGLGKPRPARNDAGSVLRQIRRLGLLQIDSVNVLVRTQYLPLFARLGAYDRAILERLAYGKRALFEYWAHEASFLPIELHPLLRYEMDRARRYETGWHARWAREHEALIEGIYEEVVERGPLAAGDLRDPGRRSEPWWGWADGKRALEWLFWCGRVTVAGRRNFERRYDLTERVIPRDILALPTPPVEEAHRQLLLMGARAHGIGTAADIADYFRLKTTASKPLLEELVEAGALRKVRVEGWKDPAYLDPAARIPRRVDARALLSPFDPVVWERKRTERMFGFRYRIEIYTPASKRVYGYYVLPFLLGEHLVARVDLKSDRKAGRLLVQAAHAEPSASSSAIAGPLAEELRAMAAWLGLDAVHVVGAGDLAPDLARALAPKRAVAPKRAAASTGAGGARGGAPRASAPSGSLRRDARARDPRR